MTLFVAVRAPLRLPDFRRHAQDCGKLGVNLLAFGDEVFDACNLCIDVQKITSLLRLLRD